jgi:succinate--hydroxymethylglutarate CoA-transferase
MDRFDDPQIKSRGLVQSVEHSTLGPVKVVGPPIKYSETPTAVRSAPPLLNEHADHVLSHILGYNADKIALLRAQGAFGK